MIRHGVLDAMESGYDTNWANLLERVAISQSRSKEEFAKLKAIENRLKNGDPGTEVVKSTVWSAVSKRDVTKRDIENRCKKWAEVDVVKSDSMVIPRPSLRVQGSSDFGHQKPATTVDMEEQKVRARNCGQKCRGCGQTVYPKELLEARKGAAFHERCFRCEECGLKLSLKTFVANPRDPGDPRVFCRNHAPQLDTARVDNTARIIAGCQQAPKMTVFNGQIRGPDAGKAVKYDTSALGIQTALNAPRLSQRASHHPPPPDVVKSDVIGLRYF